MTPDVDLKDDAQRRLRLAYSGWPGSVWKHHKGGLYRVDSVVVDEDTLVFRANYTSLARGSSWSRTVPAWLEAVPALGGRRPRFVPHAAAAPAAPTIAAFGEETACEVACPAVDLVVLKLSEGGRSM